MVTLLLVAVGLSLSGVLPHSAVGSSCFLQQYQLHQLSSPNSRIQVTLYVPLYIVPCQVSALLRPLLIDASELISCTGCHTGLKAKLDRHVY
jgi:hypothetical protein